MIWVIAVLYVVSAGLQFAGLWKLFANSSASGRELVDHFNVRGKLGTSTIGEIETRELLGAANTAVEAQKNLGLVGLGLGFGAVASIWSLFI